MVLADDSLRTSMHVASPFDAYESSALNAAQTSAPSIDNIEPVYSERAYFPATKESHTAFARHTEAAVVAPAIADAALLSETSPTAELIGKPTRKPVLKGEKTLNTLPGTNKPPRVGVNIEWVQKGVGWDCREVYYVGKQRRRRHLGHIGRQKWEDMQQQFQGEALEQVLSEWIEERRAEKSLSLNNENAAE
jgi:hypothetical protein